MQLVLFRNLDHLLRPARLSIPGGRRMPAALPRAGSNRLEPRRRVQDTNRATNPQGKSSKIAPFHVHRLRHVLCHNDSLLYMGLVF